jgi:hypothetical protein
MAMQVMQDIINNLGEQGIYTIVDCHQDLFSRYFCGEGVPDWAVPRHSALPFPRPAVRAHYPNQPGTQYPDLNSCLNVCVIHTDARTAETSRWSGCQVSE